MRISSPPTTHSCFYGIDTPERSKLLAASHTVEEMAQLIGADSLAFISIDGLYRALGKHGPRSRASRITATPASPATIRFRCRTSRTTPTGNSACWPRTTDARPA